MTNEQLCALVKQGDADVQNLLILKQFSLCCQLNKIASLQ